MNWGTTLLGGMVGAMLTFMIIAPMVKNNLVLMGLLIVFVGIGGFAGKKLNNYIRVWGTALVGAGLLCLGMNSFFGGMPNLFNLGSSEGDE